jgi:hypothetical protein
MEKLLPEVWASIRPTLLKWRTYRPQGRGRLRINGVKSFAQSGVDEVICISVNDAFVMNEWRNEQKAWNVAFLPDGNGDFSRGMGMLAWKRYPVLMSITMLNGWKLASPGKAGCCRHGQLFYLCSP